MEKFNKAELERVEASDMLEPMLNMIKMQNYNNDQADRKAQNAYQKTNTLTSNKINGLNLSMKKSALQ